MRVINGGPNVQVEEAVLFPFDDHSMPFRYRLQIGLVPGTNPYKPHEKVLQMGPPGTPDHLNISFYGTVVRVGGRIFIRHEENNSRRGGLWRLRFGVYRRFASGAVRGTRMVQRRRGWLLRCPSGRLWRRVDQGGSTGAGRHGASSAPFW